MSFLDKFFGLSKSKPEGSISEKPRRDQQQAKSTQSREVADLIKALRDQDEKVRYDAAWKLSKHPGEPTVNALIEALRDDNSKVGDRAAESLRVMADRGNHMIPPKPLLESLKNKPNWWALKECLRKLGYDSQVEEILSQAYTAGPKYDVRCIGFGCPHCGVEITRAPMSWPAHGNMVPFYAQEDLYRAGAYHIELICRGCGKTVYVVWDDDPR